jgi:hypothetical protein
MRADAHYVDSLDSTPAKLRVESIAVGKIDRRDQGAHPGPELVESIRRLGVLQPLIVQNRNGRTRLLAGQKRLDAAVAAGLSDVPCIVREVDDEVARDVTSASNVFGTDAGVETIERAADAMMGPAGSEAGTELARSLTTLGISATLLGPSVSGLTYGTTAALLRAELWRATCLLQAVRVLRSEVDARRKRFAVQPLVTRVLDACEPERRLRGLALNRQLTLSQGRILGDEELLACALSGLVLSTFQLLDGTDVQTTVLARLEPGGDFTFSITQDGVGAPAAWLALSREDASGGRPIGAAAIPIAAARRLVEETGGRLRIAEWGRGTEIHVTIPSIS